MTHSPDHETRIIRLERRTEEVATDATAARRLAASQDHDVSDLGVKVDANRRAINALGEQTRARFDRIDARFDRLEGRFDLLEGRVDALEIKVDAGLAYMQAKFAEMDNGFAAMRHGFDQSAAGFARIAELITARDDDR